ncbi:hypothetical protein [Microbulbifer sp. 2205BS26-8]|uniref:hypothetical protein n=1 Tax=Microbulbifer sp. 2205BS26-8 TaxID=3064386 RepID=UPI00273FD62B|nr:hypothetical protein [Microbulbifer sp. 2205BS26-8]MDP5211136.1 hypothetical protein [Microbulbifer sp. 2205BS26-8]
MKDAGVGLEIIRNRSNEIQVKIDVSYNFAISFQKTWYTIKFSEEEFRNFQNCLRDGVVSWHGHSSILGAQKIYITKQNHPNNYRNVRMYRRFFILGVSVVPVALSQEIVRGILEAKV